ncbi:hypothetical protein P171DRAFT_359033 [Karstenula rhodostoma CBS 690.94]|uniref:Oxidoreductase-like protein n=1 Tax=Karstenula rhodostoma CBS 690.94 TaxID=1392251 RepID=A0A9P4UDU1_9PLEO|nr:hypothetical protein P171DRAFT_359033 [Karstenula rhodostoma CBS 690.94]
MSAPAIEARSLSTLTSLASNPPSYPRNPTHVRHEPLVLYIARVPGSRDVFLSPMKPREKVVTAEDIQNSLYFVHVEQPEDAHFIETPPLQGPPHPDSRPTSPHGSQLAAVQRKPVSNPVTGVPTAAKRKPVPSTLDPVSGFETTHNNARNSQQISAGLLGPDYVPRQSFEDAQYQDENRPPLPQRPTQQPASPGASLILIRRDPASGAQWNVARIDDPLVMDVSSSTLNEPMARRKPGAPAYIAVTNPGYSKFLYAQQPAVPPLVSRNTNASIATYSPAQGSRSANQVEIDREDGVFRRRLWMEGSKHPGGEFGHRRLKSHESNMSGGSSRNSFEGTQRTSLDCRPPATPPFLTRENQSYSSIQVSEKQSTFRGYVFTSPWNGRCEFVTGAGGGSLKCRHIVPGLQGAPPVALSVSELRFNLPSSSKASTPRGEESSKRSSFFHKPRHSRNNSSMGGSRAESTEDVRRSFDRMDLSLGQEFAGGGFGGKQAKLGKLIIEDEGLKMMDLLVAANVALWWRVYER